MGEVATQVQPVLSFVKTILELFLAQRVSEGFQMRELADRVSIELVDTSERFLSDGFLVVGEEQASELFPLEEVLAVVLRL